MLPTHRTAMHPGRVLQHEFLVPMDLSQKALALHLGVSVQRVNELVRGKRGVSAETAWLLAEAFGTSPEFWINLQTAHDLSVHRPTRHIARIEAT